MTTGEIVMGSLFLVLCIPLIIWGIRTNRRDQVRLAHLNRHTLVLQGKLADIGSFQLKSTDYGQTWLIRDECSGSFRELTAADSALVMQLQRELKRTGRAIDKSLPAQLQSSAEDSAS